MPIYTFDCPKCGATKDDLVGVGEDTAGLTCVCGGALVKRGAYRTRFKLDLLLGTDRSRAHFASDPVQAGLKSGDLYVPHKGEDIFHEGPEDDPYRQAQAELAEDREVALECEEATQMALAGGDEFRDWQAQRT